MELDKSVERRSLSNCVCLLLKFSGWFICLLCYFGNFFHCIIQILNCGNKQVTSPRSWACSISDTSKSCYQFLKSRSELLTSPTVSNGIWTNFSIIKISPGESPLKHTLHRSNKVNAFSALMQTDKVWKFQKINMFLYVCVHTHNAKYSIWSTYK